MKQRWAWCLMGVLVACEAQATPISIMAPPTNTPIITQAAIMPIRYALLAPLGDFEWDTSIQSATGTVDVLDSTDTTGYDVAIGLGLQEGWQVSPQSLSVGLLLNTTTAPFDNLEWRNLLQDSLDSSTLLANQAIGGVDVQMIPSSSITSIRQRFASLGRPDGMDLTIASLPMPTLDGFVESLRASNIAVTLRLIAPTDLASNIQSNQAHAYLVTWTTDTARTTLEQFYGANALIPLYRVPIRYRANDGLTLTIADNGLPLANR